MSDTTITITAEERTLLRKIHEQGWDIDDGDLSIYRDIDGDIKLLATDFDAPEEIARELAQVWHSAWPIAARLLDALEQAEANVARLTKMVDWLAKALVERGHFIGDITSVSIAANWKEAARRAVADAEREVKG